MTTQVLDLSATEGQKEFIRHSIIRLIEYHNLDPDLVVEEIVDFRLNQAIERLPVEEAT